MTWYTDISIEKRSAHSDDQIVPKISQTVKTEAPAPIHDGSGATTGVASWKEKDVHQWLVKQGLGKEVKQ